MSIRLSDMVSLLRCGSHQVAGLRFQTERDSVIPAVTNDNVEGGRPPQMRRTGPCRGTVERRAPILWGNVTRRSCRGKVESSRRLSHRQKVRYEFLAGIGQDAFRMELHALDGMEAVTQAHDCAAPVFFRGPGADL